ncbi:transporter substrate-binding domain-containing protein [Actinomadura adrarensis]|uniref:Transporter substrate-binding domain-containing protein n=1 Tax=Actinomadura adrarensis TaxID=1819600 RepID=A0ABW3C8S1_9ACTN
MRVLVAIVLVAGLLTAGCGGARGDSILDKESLVVGVRPDLPSLGFRRPDETFEGFDIDVARYMARRLGKDIRFIPVFAADRVPVLRDGRADLVLATMSVTPDRKTEVAFAGPYFNSFQDVMVRTELTDVKAVRDLRGRKFCAVEGTSTAKRLQELHGMTAQLVDVKNYDQCVTLLRSGAVDAVTTNDVILAGLIRQHRGLARLLNVKLSEQRTAIGMRQGDIPGCEALNRAIAEMYQDGTARKLVTKWFDGTGLDMSIVEVPQFEGCD